MEIHEHCYFRGPTYGLGHRFVKQHAGGVAIPNFKVVKKYNDSNNWSKMWLFCILLRMACYQEITCPACGGNPIMKPGRSAEGAQRYRCQNPECEILDYCYKACEPGIKEQVVDMSINGSYRFNPLPRYELTWDSLSLKEMLIIRLDSYCETIRKYKKAKLCHFAENGLI